MTMNLKQIVEKYIRENGFDGLYCERWSCDCNLNDLMKCELIDEDCQPGYQREANEMEKEAGHDYVITPEKPKGNQC